MSKNGEEVRARQSGQNAANSSDQSPRTNAVRSRRGFKAAFTRVSNTLEKDIQGLRAAASTIEDKAHKIRNLSLFLGDLELKFRQLDNCHQDVLAEFDGSGDDPESEAIDPQYQTLGRLRLEVDKFSEGIANRHESSGSQSEASVVGLTPQLTAVMGLQYDVTRDVRLFSGEDILAYATFQLQWKRAESRLKEIGKGPIELLQEFKRVLKGQALQLVEYLPEIDENYAKAIAQIRRVYDDPSVQIKTIVDRLIDMPTIEINKASFLKGFSFVNQALQSFEGLQLTAEDLSTIFFISLCERKLNKNSLQTWHKYVQSKVDPNLPMGIDISCEAFLDVLLEQVKLAPDRGIGCEEESKSKAYKSHSKGSAPTTFLATQDHKCLFCNRSGHRNFVCFKMQKMGYEEVEDIRRANRLCTRCLEPYNFEHHKQCKGPICSVHDCGSPTKHCKYLHNPNTRSICVQQSPGVDQASERDLDNPVCSPIVIIAKQVENGQVRGILRTCIGFIKNIGDGELLEVRFLLDATAEQNLIRRRCAQDLGLDGPRQYLQMSVAGGGSSKRTQEKIVEFQIQSLDGSYTSNPIKATTISSIAQPVKPITLNRSNFAHLHDITFTEEYPSSGELGLDVLIGEPLFTHLCIAAPVTGLLSEPAAQYTKLGWILCGAHPKGSAEIPAAAEMFAVDYPEAVQEIRSNLYMDDLSTTADSEDLARKLLDDVVTVLALAFRRFISRRGIPQTCYSDNVKTFKGADKELRRIFKTINWDHAEESMSRFKITFQFSTSNAPWTNGITERMVGLTKKVLRIALHATTLTTQELETVLFECEVIVNNRPLASVTEGDLLLPVTPAQLCVGRDLLHLPDPGRIKGQEEPQFVGKW
ncbi:uncharacterized protein LOC131883373 [Tigriopus californicus]|uniref:uncharacterized protein LOC131883373 n=1 Tax=Tigriopus californicus TaxID=6832 RepID=UPI0027DA0B4C|nr:uncharacterized protein LOC131883373 [Tigriopus californicus]